MRSKLFFILSTSFMYSHFHYYIYIQEEIEKINHSIPSPPFWGYIYKLSDTTHPISYIGSTTVSYDFRYATHLHALNFPPTTKLYKWYGERDVVMEPIIKCLVKTTLQLTLLEDAYIVFYNTLSALNTKINNPAFYKIITSQNPNKLSDLLVSRFSKYCIPSLKSLLPPYKNIYSILPFIPHPKISYESSDWIHGNPAKQRASHTPSPAPPSDEIAVLYLFMIKSLKIFIIIPVIGSLQNIAKSIPLLLLPIIENTDITIRALEIYYSNTIIRYSPVYKTLLVRCKELYIETYRRIHKKLFVAT